MGINLQRLRRAKAFSQEELAHSANVHQTYLSGVECGKRNPSIRVLERLTKALGEDKRSFGPGLGFVFVFERVRGFASCLRGEIFAERFHVARDAINADPAR